MSELRRIRGLWRKRARGSGKEYMSGKLPDGRRLVLFANDRDRQPKDAQPDWVLYVDAAEQPEQA